MKKFKSKSGFTLIELIFTIVLLAIIGGIISMTIGSVYYNYAQQKELSKLEINSNLVLTEIRNLLKRSIPNSIMKYSGANTTNSANYTPLLNINNGDLTNPNERMIWLDIDKESLYGNGSQAYYNQWFDLKSSTGNKMVSVNSDFTKIIPTETNTLLLTGGAQAEPAVYYVYGNQEGTPFEKFYNSTQTALFPIDTTAAINQNDFQLTKIPKEIGEIYYITDTGYTLNINNKNQLLLTHNFQPWTVDAVSGNQETFTNGTSEVLMENVKSFEYWVEYNTLRIRMCINSNIPISVDAAGKNIYSELCKETSIGAM